MTDLFSRLFVKNYRQTTDPQVRAAYGTMVSITGIIANLFLFIGKFIVGMLFGSVSIVGDAVNNLSDAGSQIISLISFRIASKPADRKHPFGHGRIEYVASMIISFLVLLIGFELLKESIDKILHPSLPERNWVAVFVLLGSVLVKVWLGLFNRKIGNRIDSSVMRATAADSFSDVLSTSAVLLTTLLMLLFPDMTLNLDAYMGVIVAILILWAGAKILNDAKNAILGGAPPDEIISTIRETVKKYPDALGIHDMTVHNYGPGRMIAALHIEVDGKRDIFEMHDMIDNIERDLRLNFDIEATIHMDPIVTDDERINALHEKLLSALKNIDESLQIHDFRFVSGHTHSNLIFDIQAPFELALSDEELKAKAADAVSSIDPSYFIVVKIDRG